MDSLSVFNVEHHRFEIFFVTKPGSARSIKKLNIKIEPVIGVYLIAVHMKIHIGSDKLIPF